jgi:hypothetical protein
MGTSTAIFLVFLGCASNVVFLEMIVKEDSGAGNIVTFCQFLFISVEGLFFVSQFFTVPPIIPIRYSMHHTPWIILIRKRSTIYAYTLPHSD